MKKEIEVREIEIDDKDDHIGCFGNFSMEDPICRKYCALKLRCAIEREQNLRMDLLEDLIATDSMVFKLQ